MEKCSKMYFDKMAANPEEPFCRIGDLERGCPGCCAYCQNQCTAEEEPNRCTSPDGKKDNGVGL